MRLNFSGVGDGELREGVARIGQVVSEQVRLYSTLTGAESAVRKQVVSPPEQDVGNEAPAEGARVVPFRRQAG